MSRNQPSRLFNRYPLIVPIVALGVTILLGYLPYRFFFASTQQPIMPPPAPMVSVETVTLQNIPIFYEYSGRVAGKKAVEIRARVSGTLLKRNYIEGSRVKKGTVLFLIDPAPFEAVVAQARARFIQTEKDWMRAKKLFAENALSAKEHDAALSAYEQAKADLKTAKINLEYTTVKAPITGVTSKEAVSEGSLVVADSTLLTYLTETESLYINFSIPDAEMLDQKTQIESGDIILPPDKKLHAEISLSEDMPHKVQGIVDFTDSIIDTQTGSVQSRAVVSNANQTLLPGMFVRLKVKGMTRKNAIAIPDKAVMQGPQGTFVYVATPDNTAAIKPVTLGMLSNGKRLIESGLASGDRVITEGMIKVRPNSPIQVSTPPLPKDNTPPQAPVAKKG